MTDPARRNRDLAAIHATAKQLGIDTHDQNPESEYRSMLWTLGRVRSSKDLDFTGLQRVKAHLQQIAKARGVKVPERHRQPAPAGRPRPAADRQAQVGKIRMLLRAAREHGLAWSDEYADGAARNMFHVERYEWCTPTQLRGLITALEKQLARERSKAAKAAGIL